MSRVHFKITGDNDDFKKKMQESTRIIKDSGEEASRISQAIEKTINSFGNDASKALRIYDEAVNSIGASGSTANSALRDMQKYLTDSIPIQKRAIESLKDELKSLEHELANFGELDESKEHPQQYQYLIKAVQDVRTELQLEEQELSQREKIYTGITGKLGNLRTELRQATAELARMRMEGLEGTDEYMRLEETVGGLSRGFRVLRQEQQAYTRGGMALRGLADGLGALSGAMTATAGAMGLLNSESEAYAKIQTRVQSMMAITMGLQQAQNVLHETSAFRIHTVTRAKQLWSRANVSLATTLGISTAAASALMATLTLGLSVAIGALIGVYNRWKTKQQETIALQKEFIELEVSVAKTMASTKINIAQLHKVAADYTKDIQSRKLAIQKLNEIMPDYNGYIDREGILIDNADTALKNYLVTLYKVEKAKELIAQMGDIDVEITEAEQTPAKGVSWWGKIVGALSYGVGSDGYDDFINTVKEDNEEAKTILIQDLKDKKDEIDKEVDELISDQSVFQMLFDGKDRGKGGGDGKESKQLDKYVFDRQREEGIANIRNQVKEFFDARREANLEGVAEQRRAEEEARIDYLIRWGNFEEQRLALIDKYEKDAAKAKTKAEQDSLLQALNVSLQRITSEQLKSGGLFEKMFGDASRLSTETLEEILGIEGFIDQLGLSIEETKIFKDAILNARAELESRNPFKLLTASWKEYIKSLKSEDKDATKDALARVEKSVKDSIAFLSDVGNSVGTVFSAFGNNRVGEDINSIIGIVGGVGEAGVGIGKMASGDVIGGVKDLAKGIASVVGGIVRMNDASKERAIQKMQERVDALNKSYEKLGESLEAAYSTDASQLIEQQNTLLRQKQVALRQQIAKEESKKKTDKNRVKEWKKELEEIDKLINENKEKAKDAIFGEDVKTAISNFADAYVKAWGAGEDKIKSVKDVVKNMIRATITEMMKGDFAKAVENIRDKIAYFLSDGIIDSYEEAQLDALIEEATSKSDKKYSWADRFLKDLETQGGATYGAYEKITQDQASSIDGRLTGIHVLLIENATTFKTVSSLMGETRTLSVFMLEELQGINKNTKLINDTNEKLDKIIKNTNTL